MQAAVAQVMGRVPSFKVELALKFIKSKLTDFRSEERRKVLHMKHATTLNLAFQFAGARSCTVC